MYKWLKMFFCVVLGVAALALSGCGKDMTGTYIADMGEGEPYVRVLDVEKGDKDGYIINYREIGYNISKSDGKGTKRFIYRGISTRKYTEEEMKSHYVVDLKCVFYNNLDNQLFASAPNDNNKMIFKDSKNAGFLTGTIAIDKDGNLIDENGDFSMGRSWQKTQGRKFTKVKEFKIEELKEKIKKNIEEYAHKKYDYDKPGSESKVGEITFVDTDK